MRIPAFYGEPEGKWRGAYRPRKTYHISYRLRELLYMLRDLICTHQSDGTVAVSRGARKYCKACGFCHGADFERCLKLAKKKKVLP